MSGLSIETARLEREREDLEAEELRLATGAGHPGTATWTPEAREALRAGLARRAAEQRAAAEGRYFTHTYAGRESALAYDERVRAQLDATKETA